MPRTLGAHSHVVVADPRPTDYRDLAMLAGENSWHVHFLTSGREALEFVRRNRAELWMINSRLPDMTGFDLLEMLRDLPMDARLFIVADKYAADEERQACVSGADLYLCKDADRSFDCQPLLAQLAQLAVRAPP